MLFGSPGIIQHAPWLFYILKFFSLNAPGKLSLSFHIVSNTAFIVGFSTLPRDFRGFSIHRPGTLELSVFRSFRCYSYYSVGSLLAAAKLSFATLFDHILP